jgi:hypothetical protein
MLVISALRRLRQEDYKLEINVGLHIDTLSTRKKKGILFLITSPPW